MRLPNLRIPRALLFVGVCLLYVSLPFHSQAWSLGLMKLAMLLCVVAMVVLVRIMQPWGFRQTRTDDRDLGFLPAPPPAPEWASRVAEATALAAAGLTILGMKATDSNAGGLMLLLDKLTPGAATLNVTVFACATAGVLAATLVALWRTGPGAILMGVVLAAYAWVFGYPNRLTERLVRPSERSITARYTIRTGDIVGADLWVNGVLLGRTPVETTLADFLERIPYWPKPLKGCGDGTDEVRLLHYGPTGKSTSIRQRCITFRAPRQEPRLGGRDLSHNLDGRQYYACVKLDGECGFGLGTGSGASGSRYKRSYETRLHVDFLSHRERMEKLLDMARLSDCRATSAWFRAMDSYGKRGWMALRRAAMREPELMPMLDAWAAWRYQLDGATNAGTAWRAFLRVCAAADEQREYHTASVDGRATELLVPKLDPEQLARHAEALLKRYRGGPGFARCEEYGRVQFEVVVPRDGSEARIPPSAAVVAHAVWMLDEQLDREDDSTPNIVERRVTPALIRWFPYPYRSEAAGALGGPAIERFLIRQDWRRPVRSHGGDHRARLSSMGVNANRWLHLLANLRGPFGAQFRARHEDLLLRLADRLVSGPGGAVRPPEDFLFLDLDRGTRSLAVRHWPRYRAAAVKWKHDSLDAQWAYLTRMEPLSTVEMYLDTWRRAAQDYPWQQGAFRWLESLPDVKRQAVIDAIVHEVDESRNPPKQWPGTFVGWREHVVNELKARGTDRRVAEETLAELHADPSADRRSRVALWLEHTRPDHPLVGLLAQQEDPQLRLLAVPALKAHPTRHNREILQRLLTDPDLQVKAAATKVDGELIALAARDPMDFALGSGASQLPVDAHQQSP